MRGVILRVFRRPNERAARIPDFFTTLLATLIAHGTNLGIATMAHSVEGITVDMLAGHVTRCLREDTLNAANTILVNYHHQLPLSAVWGDGTVSSSDGQRFGLQANSLLGSLYPRYFGYYDKALTVYTHTSDQHSVLHTQVIACAPCARRFTSLMDCSTTIPSYGPRSILLTNTALPTNSGFVTSWVFP